MKSNIIQYRQCTTYYTFKKDSNSFFLVFQDKVFALRGRTLYFFSGTIEFRCVYIYIVTIPNCDFAENVANSSGHKPNYHLHIGSSPVIIVTDMSIKKE